MSATDIDIRIGGAAFSGRYAFNKFLAVDGAVGFFGLGGEFTGGMTPISPIDYEYWDFITLAPNGDTSLSGYNYNLSANLEVQPVGTKDASLIFFGGPLFQAMNMDMASPYTLTHRLFHGCTGVGCGSGGGTGTSPFYKYDNRIDTLNISATLAGTQVGVQGSLLLGFIKITPFYMMTSISGTTTLADDLGKPQEYIVKFKGTSLSQDIPTMTSTSFGADIIIVPWGLSIGSMLQQLKDSGNSHNNVKTTIFRLGYRFGNADVPNKGLHAGREKRF